MPAANNQSAAKLTTRTVTSKAFMLAPFRFGGRSCADPGGPHGGVPPVHVGGQRGAGIGGCGRVVGAEDPGAAGFRAGDSHRRPAAPARTASAGTSGPVIGHRPLWTS